MKKTVSQHNYIEIGKSMFENILTPSELGFFFKIPVGGAGLKAKRVILNSASSDSNFCAIFKSKDQLLNIREREQYTAIPGAERLHAIDQYIPENTFPRSELKTFVIRNAAVILNREIVAEADTFLDLDLMIYFVSWVPLTRFALSYEIIYEVED